MTLSRERILLFIFPLLMFTDLTSGLLGSNAILNIGRGLRLGLLLLFVVDFVRYWPVIRHYFLVSWAITYLFILFAYAWTDRDVQEAMWQFSKTVFWVLGAACLFAYQKIGLVSIESYFRLIRRVVLIAFGFTILYQLSGRIEDDYNVAAYTVTFTVPILFYMSNGFSRHTAYILLAFLAVLLTFKRGAMLALTIATISYFILYARINFSFSKAIKLATLVMLCLAVTASAFLVSEKNDMADRFSSSQFDLQNEAAGSGRVGLYGRLYRDWAEADAITQLVGHGNQEDSRRVSWRRTHAHSDVFGYLYNYGVVGVSLIASLYLFILYRILYLQSRCRHQAAVAVSAFIILVGVNFYSGMFRATDAIFLVSAFSLISSSPREIR